MSSIFGGKPKEQPPSEAEMALAEKGVQQTIKHRTHYVPIAKAEAKDALTDDIRQTLRNRKSADLAQDRKELGSYPNVINPIAGIESSMLADKTGKQKADAGAKAFQDKRLTTSISTANKEGGQAQNALSTLATINTDEAINKMKNDAAENKALWEMGEQLAGSAYMKYGDPNSKLMKAVQAYTKTSDDEIDWIQRGRNTDTETV